MVTFPCPGTRCSAGFSSLLTPVTEGTIRAALPDMVGRMSCSVGMLRPSLLRGFKADLHRWPWVRALGSWFSGPGLRFASRKRGDLMV